MRCGINGPWITCIARSRSVSAANLTERDPLCNAITVGYRRWIASRSPRTVPVSGIGAAPTLTSTTANTSTSVEPKWRYSVVLATPEPREEVLDLEFTRGPTLAGMTPAPEPVVCTLRDREAGAQALEWVDLQRLALHSAPLATGAQMTFSSVCASRILDLADRESTCCTFLTIDSTLDGDAFVVEITSKNPDALDVIAALSGVSLP